MNDVLNFIRDFNIADYGATGWYLLGGLVSLVLIWEISHRYFLAKEDSRKYSVKRVVKFTLAFLVYTAALFLMLQDYLNEKYYKIFLMLFFLMVSKNVFGRFYVRYDKFIDAIADKTTRIQNPQPDKFKS